MSASLPIRKTTNFDLFVPALVLSLVVHGLLALPLWLWSTDTAHVALEFARPGGERSHRFEIALVAPPTPAPVTPGGIIPARPETSTGGATQAARFPSDVVRRENRRIQNTLRYPRLAIKMNWQGDVLVTAAVDPAGVAQNVQVMRSSGHAVLDRAAMDGVRRHRFTAGAGSETIRLHFSFRLREGTE